MAARGAVLVVGVVGLLGVAGPACVDTRVDLWRPKPRPAGTPEGWTPLLPGGGAPALGTPMRPAPDRTVGLYVALVWTTPGDPDPTDQGITDAHESVGSDLDLHVVHPGVSEGLDVDGDGAADGWFDPVFDVYFHARDHFWGAPGADDDPIFIDDDTDGGGPEEVLVEQPEAGLCYRVGVHVWDDWGFGPSDAVVRVSYDGERVFESQPVRLERGDLWDVARVCWSDAAPAAVGCDGAAGTCRPRVMQGYPVPERVRPL